MLSNRGGDSGNDVYALLVDIKEGRVPTSEKPFNLQGVSLAEKDLSGMDLSGVDLAGADLSGSNLSGAKLFKSNLQGAMLVGAKLAGAECSGADFSKAVLNEADCSQAGLGMSTLIGAKLFRCNLENATMSLANLENADLRSSKMQNARIREARLMNADLTNAEMLGADLSLSAVDGATFNNADMRDTRLRLVTGFEKASWIGVDIRNVNFAGAYRLRRFVVDQNFIKEFRAVGKLSAALYYLWWITSDCGRSMLRWCVCILLLALFYAWIYTFVDIDYGDHKTFLSPVYYSIVTLTTLGYGDVRPVSTGGQIVAMIEVMSGYMMLGGLLSIFSNKIARRAD